MRKSHGWSPRKARSVVNYYGLRKEKCEAKRKPKRSYKKVLCPIENCNSVVKRIHNHLTDVHKLKRGSKHYTQCLQNVFRHEVEIANLTESSESTESLHEISDASVSSSESYKPPPVKMKSNVKPHKSVYSTIYSSSEENSEDGLKDPLDDQISDNEDDIRNTAAADASLQKIFYTFETWLKGSDGGQKNERAAVQCRRQVEMVVSYIGGPKPSLDNILRKRILRDQWLNKFEKEKQPGTIKSYLGSLNQFYRFLKCENVGVNASSERLSSLSEQVTLWGRSYRKKSAGRHWEKQMEDISSLRTPDQIRDFETSEVAREAVRLLGKYQEKGDAEPSQPEYTCIRDYLLTVICINNGSRSGALANMTLQEFERATLEDECFVVRVKNHKTLCSHGPANVVLNKSLHRYTKIFIEKFRNQLPGVRTDGDAPVFITWKQGKMTSSQVGAQMGSCWGKVFGKETSTGGATAFRKAAVSAVHQSNKDLRGDLADLMAHKQSTADRYYLLKNKGKSAVRTSQELSKIMRSSETTNMANETEDNSDDVAHSSSPLSGNSNGRHNWTSAQISELESAFATHIKRKSISMMEVRETVKDIPVLQNIPFKKVLDKIRSYFSKDDLGCEESPSLPTEIETREERIKRAGLAPSKCEGGT